MIIIKLKILPPNLRIKNRYLTLDIKSEVKLNKDVMISAIWYACLRLYGESETSAFNLWLMRFYYMDNDNDNPCNQLSRNQSDESKYWEVIKNSEKKIESNYYHFKVILRCQRGYENKVRGSLATLYNYNQKKIAISTIGISGTIASSIEKFIN